MKNFILIILFICIFFSCSTNQNLLLINREYTLKHSEFDSMSLHFNNRKECIFTHAFRDCGMDERYQKIEIICKYKLKDNILYLKNKFPIDSLKNIAYIKIPDSERVKCEYMNQYTIDPYGDKADFKGIIIDGRPFLNNAQYIGYLNYIEEERLLFKDNLLLYFKMPSPQKEMVNEAGLQARHDLDYYILGAFVLNGHTVDSATSRNILNESISNKSIPVNDIVVKKK